jgi:hypothetical protein
MRLTVRKEFDSESVNEILNGFDSEGVVYVRDESTLGIVASHS